MKLCRAQLPYKGKYPAETNAVTPIVRCMERAGYERDYNTSSCKIQAVPRRSEYCYRPDGLVQIIGYRLEMLLIQPGPKPPTVGPGASG